MSTNISDLPGPSEEEDYETQEDMYYEQDEEPQYHREPVKQQQRQYQGREEDLYRRDDGVVHMNIKKSVKEEFETPGIFDMLRKEITEENLLIFIIIFLSTTDYANNYTRQILSMLSFNVNTSSLTITLIKCALLLLIFIIAKNYVLPYIKV
jgi:hypothetical protein